MIEVAELKYSKATSRPARWVLAVPDDNDAINSAKDMDGMTVATELPITTQRYFDDLGVDVNVEYSWGTTEVKAKGKLVEGIVDITETGSSLRANNLKIVDVIMESTTRMIANKEAWADPVRRAKIESIALLLQAAIDGKDKIGLKANIPRSKMDECLALMPAETAPTVADLTDSDFVSAEIVCTAIEGREITPQLYALGARGILMYPLNVVVH